MAKKTVTSWDSPDRWYDKLVGEKGHHYHQTIIFPNLFKILGSEKIDSWLDLGCGNGVLARHLPKTVEYIGIDAAKDLLTQAKEASPKTANFFLGDAAKKLPLEKTDFSHASFILSLQNMEDGRAAISSASKHLRSGGKIILVLNHPSFRIPRQSEWGYDEKTKTQYRRINAYMSPLKIPISMQPGKKTSFTTYSFHRPLSTYTHWLKDASLHILSIEEWCSDKKSEGGRAKSEDRARLEFPLFLALIAEKT
jgi:ubiquinone/menaquinone biosynthesis C-methylase UbiE